MMMERYYDLESESKSKKTHAETAYPPAIIHHARAGPVPWKERFFKLRRRPDPLRRRPDPKTSRRKDLRRGKEAKKRERRKKV